MVESGPHKHIVASPRFPENMQMYLHMYVKKFRNTVQETI